MTETTTCYDAYMVGREVLCQLLFIWDSLCFKLIPTLKNVILKKDTFCVM